MNKSASANAAVGSIYASVWRMLFMGAHKYDVNPTGELLTVMTIALLDKVGYNPTISDLVEITGLTKSNVSRYVSNQFKGDFLTEVVDPEDRRQRRLCPTPKGKNEEEWHHTQTLEMTRLCNEAFRGMGDSKNPITDLKTILAGINARRTNSS